MSLLLSMIGAMGGPRVSINDASISDVTVSPTACSVSYQLTSAGVVNQILTNGGTSSIGNWITPTGAAGANYEVRATVNSGSLTSGTTGSWTALSSTQTWTLTRSTNGLVTCNLTIEIRRASDGGGGDSASITLSAERTI